MQLQLFILQENKAFYKPHILDHIFGLYYYQEVLSTQEILPDIRAISGEFFILQQDSAPAHKARMTVTLLQREVPGFIAPNLWPRNSPDLLTTRCGL